MRLRLALLAPAALFLACATPSGSTAPAGRSSGTSDTGATARSGKPGEKPTTRGQLLFDDAVKAVEAQKKGKADDEALARRFEAVLAADGNFAEADYNLGVIAERRGRIGEAKGRYESALRKKPSLRQAAVNLAVIRQNEGDLPGAVNLYSEIAKQHPEDPVSRALLAELYRITGDHEKAMELARAALIRDPKWEPAYRVMMRSYLDRKQLAMARLVGLRAQKLEESDPDIFLGLGNVLLEEKQPEKAAAQFEKAIAAKPDFLPARIALARLSLQRENYLAAETHLKAILKAEPKNAEAHLNLGVAYKGQGQFDKAMQEYDTAEKLKPDLAAIYLNRGILLHRHKDAPDRGLELYRKYLAVSGGDVALPVEAPVFALMKEAEDTLQMRQQAAAQEAEAKKLEEAQKLQEQRLKQAEDEERKKNGASAVQPAEGQPSAQPVPAKGKAPAPSKAAPAKSAPAASKPAPAAAPTDEPTDAL